MTTSIRPKHKVTLLDREMISEETLSVLPANRDKSSFAFAQEITKPWGGLEPVLDWCKSELQEDWRWQMVEMSTDTRPGRYIFYFDGQQDCCAFVLKWC